MRPSLLVFVSLIVAAASFSPADDELRPYPDDSAWGPSHRTRAQLLEDMNRLEESLHKRAGGWTYNTTHEIFYPPGFPLPSPPSSNQTEGGGSSPSSNSTGCVVGWPRSRSPLVEHKRIVRTSTDGSLLTGHAYYIAEPHKHFVVLPPLGGCGERAKVTDTAISGECQVASNAGFFNTRTGACLGNLISNGVVIQNSGLHNANFGLRKDGGIGVGYFTSEEVAQGMETEWQQLVAGVVWMVRKGRNYVGESARLEDMSVPETTNFVSVRSARNSIGHDRRGRLMMVVVDGKTGRRGVNLYEFADLLISLGAVNAINLDGGGSAQMAENGVIVNIPSDECADDNRFTCERQITSIVCIRP